MVQPSAFRGWAGIAVVVLVVPMVLLAVYPGWRTVLALSVLGLAASAGLVVAVQRMGLQALASVGSAADRLFQSFGDDRKSGTKANRVPRPTGYWKGRLIEAVGGQCEVQTCTTIGHLEVHHISEHARGGGNELRNLLVLCPNHHKLAGSGGINKSRQRVLATRSRRFNDTRFGNRWDERVVRREKSVNEFDAVF